MGVSGIKAVDDNIVVMLSLGMNIFFIIERHGDMGYFFTAEEDQVTCLQLFAFDAAGPKIMLLVGIAWNDIASHTIAKLREAAAIYPFPTCPSPKIGSAEKGARVRCNHIDRHTRIDVMCGV